MNAEVLRATLRKTIETREPILVVSPPGCGKSEIITEVAKDKGVDLAVFHPSVEEPTDVKGFPWCYSDETGKPRAEFVTFGEMARLLSPKRAMVAMFDDLGQANEQMQAALMQVLWARELNGKKISPNVTFIGATNDIKDKAGVSGFIEPLKSRWTSIIRYSPTTEDWVDWAFSKNMPDMLISFVKFSPQSLHAFVPSKTLDNTPCPRTVAAVGRILNAGYPVGAEYELISGAVGEKFALDFNTYRALYGKMPDLDAILADPDNAEVDFGEPGIQIAVATGLIRKTTEKTVGAVIRYVTRMPKEFAVMVIKDLRRTKEKIIKGTKEYADWIEKEGRIIIGEDYA